MSKLALFLTIPVVAGLVAWNVSLSSEISELRQRLETESPAVPAAADAPKSSGAAAEPRPRDTSRAMQQVNELAVRLAEVEKRIPAPAGHDAAVPEAGSPAPAVLPAEVVAAFTTDAFKGAVNRVLDEKDAVRRKERMDRVADARVRFLLRDLTVTDAQRNDVKKLVVASMEKIEQIRENEAIPDDQRRQEVQSAMQEQVESLAAVLDAQAMEQVRQRSAAPPAGLRRGGQGGDGGGNGGGNGGRGGLRGQPGTPGR